MEIREAGLEHVDGVLALWSTSRTEHAVTDDTPEGVERLLRDAPGLERLAVLVRHSHERWDGTGYPDGLRALEIPLASRIIAVCDAWDAMRTDRPYQRARSHEEAIGALVEGSGTQFDPCVVSALVSHVTRGPLH